MPTPPDSFAAVYLREVGEIAAIDRPGGRGRARERARRRAARAGPAVHPRRRRRRGARLARGQRLPQALRLRGYAPTDNVAELTARTNDEGWETSFDAWLRTSRLSARDAILVFSVGGGNREHNVSVNLVRALELAREVGARVFGVVGRADGATAEAADVCIVVEAPPERRTPHVEEFQAVVWHLLVSHPALATAPGKWESVEAADGS